MGAADSSGEEPEGGRAPLSVRIGSKIEFRDAPSRSTIWRAAISGNIRLPCAASFDILSSLTLPPVWCFGPHRPRARVLTGWMGRVGLPQLIHVCSRLDADAEFSRFGRPLCSSTTGPGGSIPSPASSCMVMCMRRCRFQAALVRSSGCLGVCVRSHSGWRNRQHGVKLVRQRRDMLGGSS